MRFKTKRAIGAGEEITAHYAADYCACLSIVYVELFHQAFFGSVFSREG